MRIPANTWVTVGSCFGLAQQLLCVTVDSDAECHWRERLGWLTTASGSFRRRCSFHLFNQTAQIRSPVATDCDVITRWPAEAPRPGPAARRPW